MKSVSMLWLTFIVCLTLTGCRPNYSPEEVVFVGKGIGHLEEGRYYSPLRSWSFEVPLTADDSEYYVNALQLNKEGWTGHLRAPPRDELGFFVSNNPENYSQDEFKERVDQLFISRWKLESPGMEVVSQDFVSWKPGLQYLVVVRIPHEFKAVDAKTGKPIARTTALLISQGLSETVIFRLTECPLPPIDFTDPTAASSYLHDQSRRMRELLLSFRYEDKNGEKSPPGRSGSSRSSALMADLGH